MHDLKLFIMTVHFSVTRCYAAISTEEIMLHLCVQPITGRFKKQLKQMKSGKNVCKLLSTCSSFSTSEQRIRSTANRD